MKKKNFSILSVVFIFLIASLFSYDPAYAQIGELAQRLNTDSATGNNFAVSGQNLNNAKAAPGVPSSGDSKAPAANIVNSSYYKPIAAWTGRLVLPAVSERESDGSVFIVIHNSPEPGLVGKKIRLRWNFRNPEDGWFAKISPDLNFDPEKVKTAQKYSLQLPTRLGGWSRVSPLESLAGARPADDVMVALRSAQYSNGSVYINEEPAQICGSHAALVKFSGPANGNFRTVIHYNPSTGKFDGPAETVSILPQFKTAVKPDPVSSTLNIEKSNFNGGGYYIYGVLTQNTFVVNALEPRAVNLMKPSLFTGGKNNIKKYISKQHFDQMSPGMRRSALLMPEVNSEYTYYENDAGVNSYIDKYWPVGSQAILVHVFGWRKNTITGESGSQALGLVTGHFAFGIATVINDPFTGEKRFDIEYKQVYAHNNTGIISGTHKWHSYMGDLKRGWMYTIPVSDTIVRIPELMPYNINGWRINPIKGFSRVLEMMMAVYRTGAGGGVSGVRPDISCVQDSHYSLYASLMVFENSILSNPAASDWLKNNPSDPDVQRFNSLRNLTQQIKDRITILGISRSDWRVHFSNPLGTRDPGKAEQVIRALISIKSVFPRDGNDNLLLIAADRNYRMWSILSAMDGGTVEGLWPIAPTSLVNH